jgi:hypothetical protein
VHNECHRRRVVVARGSEGWGALDEELSPGVWELPNQVAPIRIAGSMGSSPLPGVCHLSYTHLLLVEMDRVDVSLWNYQDAADGETSTPTRSLGWVDSHSCMLSGLIGWF